MSSDNVTGMAVHDDVPNIPHFRYKVICQSIGNAMTVFNFDSYDEATWTQDALNNATNVFCVELVKLIEKDNQI